MYLLNRPKGIEHRRALNLFNVTKSLLNLLNMTKSQLNLLNF